MYIHILEYQEGYEKEWSIFTDTKISPYGF